MPPVDKTNIYILFKQPFRSFTEGDPNKTRSEHPQDQEVPLLEALLFLYNPSTVGERTKSTMEGFICQPSAIAHEASAIALVRIVSPEGVTRDGSASVIWAVVPIPNLLVCPILSNAHRLKRGGRSL